MLVTNREIIVTKAWLSEFMLLQGHFKGETGKPLYSYLLEFEEFEKVKQLLNCSGLINIGCIG